ncbi:LysR substrate-binding domain-containing protein [Alkalimonas collagenimarina]|uniref:LysR substrate-binding domain-containing protein n=1 Tax=Alkalimonas collagenimarina TaxID=400390 RepID=A0ABT9GUL2_9GAMM|nr:LysR substrate-binding domain-containing protein [Alkalimonas collagenimarina]MDP4534733.1 LysR substrate-binding domain-containing protein [Alkalimonas collagenimarina]
MLNLNDLYFFVQAVDNQGFAAAARQLGIPKSTVSKRVAELEKSLGVRLIQRTSRTFTVTETGQDFYRHAAAVLIEAEMAEAVVKNRLAEPRGTVRLCASVPTAQLWLATLLPKLALTYPAIKLQLDVADRFVDIVREGVDIALRDHFSPLPDSELIQRRLSYQPGYLIASPAYLSKHGTPTDPDELSAHHGVLTSATETSWKLSNPQKHRVEAQPLPAFIANESMVLLEAALAGLGITCLPSKICHSYLECGALVRVLPDWTAGGVTTTLLMPHRRGQLPAVRVVADFLIAHLASPPVHETSAS